MSNFFKIRSVPSYFTYKCIWMSTITVHLWVKFGTNLHRVPLGIHELWKIRAVKSMLHLWGSMNFCSCFLHFIPCENSVKEMYTEICRIIVSFMKVGAVKAMYLLGPCVYPHLLLLLCDIDETRCEMRMWRCWSFTSFMKNDAMKAVLSLRTSWKPCDISEVKKSWCSLRSPSLGTPFAILFIFR